jgi:chemotaxis protein histidine kinase CheA
MKPIILRAPEGETSGGGAAGVTGGAVNVDDAVMDVVFDKLGLPAELRGEKAAPSSAKSATEGKKDAKETEGQETEEQKAEREAQAAKDAKDQKAAEGAAPERAEAEEQMTAWQKQILGLTDKIGEAEGEEKTRLEQELTEAQEQCELWENKVKDLGPTLEEPEFSPEQKEWVESLAEGHEATVTELKGKLEEATAKAQDLETRLAKAGDTPIAVAPLHPLFLVDDAGKIAEFEQHVAAFEAWAIKNWDGTEEKTNAEGKVLEQGYTKEQVRERYTQVKELREKIVPAARETLKVRAEQTALARKSYPELFDAKRTEHKLAEELLRQVPGLKVVFPNIYVVIGDALAGERLRLEREKTKGQKKLVKLPAANGKGKPLARRASAGLAASTTTRKEKGGEVNAKKFIELGGDRDALVSMIRGANLPTVEK